MRPFRVRSLLLLSALLAAGATAYYLAQPKPATHLWPLFIDSADGTHPFVVELARTQEEQRQGLMFRETLAEDSGMLFVYRKPKVQTMWMKDTPLSLDMLFIDAQGVVQRIVPYTTPHSTALIVGPRDSLYVLELRGGVTRRLCIRDGDRIRNLPPPDQPSAAAPSSR